MSKEAVDALEPFVALADAHDAKYRKRGGDPDTFPDTHPAYDISAHDLPAGVWRKARTVYQALRSEAGGERAAIVAWLREHNPDARAYTNSQLADAIERGDYHLKSPPSLTREDEHGS